ncbi:pyruvate DeHydogenase Kinase family member [Capsaspora owczarzaki ATCC 30864]|uniref:Protein-serine/threonine kinase n=1 Tax=Capsaspora owczarzaki (strain ATCC 30864) TaxID=595528 RepID=A0A0D2X1X6_CAPO3|nr:pyruvate DeHydogenase Kinase family member [Capsaspora owczarzaki ATCC 30864]KJE91574.1 pyruvate DeHydogenase Kinase family member [Capsaspora owczarzaki ATCC 30864]|eukprot:XP_004349449.2 pyruvate DeHydogenase Kinase family member [Capsaspora owczarzaki ATCC 30864]
MLQLCASRQCSSYLSLAAAAPVVTACAVSVRSMSSSILSNRHSNSDARLGAVQQPHYQRSGSSVRSFTLPAATATDAASAPSSAAGAAAGGAATAAAPLYSPLSVTGSVTPTPATADALSRWAQYKQTPISIARFAEFGRQRDVETAVRSVAFLRNELPVRLAHMTKEIESLPEKLLGQQSVGRVHGWYIKSFEDLLNFPIEESIATASNKADAEHYVKSFTEVIRNIHRRHAPVVTTMAQGILALKEAYGSDAYDRNIQYFLDRFYMSRIGIRMLIAQHCEVFGDDPALNPPRKGWVGVIDEKCNVRQIADDAAQNARFLCDQHYFASPEVEVINPRASRASSAAGGPVSVAEDVCFPYVPSHLYHMLFELLKNSMRAVVEHHGPDATTLPKVRVRIMKGEEDLTIKISDEGGGIPRSGMPHLFTYFYTTASPPELEANSSADMNHAPLAGFGYGLPLSRLYARYFGGDLHLISMEGHGTDAYIYLKVAAHEAGEVLPSYSGQPMRHKPRPSGTSPSSSHVAAAMNAPGSSFGNPDWMQSQIMRSLYTSAKNRGHAPKMPWMYMDHIYGGGASTGR